MPEISDGAFDDPRSEVVIGDSSKYIEDHPGEFDVVIMDMTDPFGPSTMLYTQEYFQT